MRLKITNKIICGFAGIGKSTLALQQAGVVDLESTPFNKDWKRYITVALHMQKNGYTVLMSCHKEVRDLLRANDVDYTVAIPHKERKEEYLQRYKKRGNDSDFIKLLSDNFESWIKEIESDEINITYVDKFLTASKE